MGHRVHYGDSDGIGKASSYRSFVSCRSGKLRFHRGSKRERDINTRLSARPAETRGKPGGALSPALPHHVSPLHHSHCTPLQRCTQTLSSHTPSHLWVQSTVPSLCHSHIPPSRTTTPTPGAAGLSAAVSIHPSVPAGHLSLGLDPPSLYPSWALLRVLEHTDTCPCAHSLPLACTSPSSAPPVQVLYNTAVLHSTTVVDKAKILRAGHH